ncbi:MAG TPA: serine/threonine-protein kinase [Kofleriaceae bacterium]|nr:serine/threonine-protein kinase [Kofleriaceae bacterium]
MTVGDDDTIASTHSSLGAARVGGDASADERIAGRYQIVRWLGAGGMGRVYEAIDGELGERVALKVLRGGLSDDAIERFRREVKLTRRIQHRNVARMFDIGEHAHERFLTMELVDGAALSQAVSPPVAWPRLRGIASQLCAGLAAAHAAGVIHRDLKPDNVLIERGTDRVVITDFGIARSGDDVGVTQVGALIGTPRYMAPEQLAGEPIDHRADVFALGVMLFELATGMRPWGGDTAIAIAVAQATTPPRALIADVPAELAAVIRDCLAIDRAQRPADVGALIARFADGVVEPSASRPTLRSPAIAPVMTSPASPPPAPRAAPSPAQIATTLGDPAPTYTTLAVLPVACAPGDETLADALLDELIDTLASAGTVRVRPAGVVRAQVDAADPRALGRALDVDHVVVGALRRTPAGVRVVARLISVADGFQIWTHRDDVLAADILATGERLARGVASALSARAVGSERATDPRAVELYLRARGELRRFWGEHARNATALLDQAAQLAPGSPPILAARAFAAVQAWIMDGTAAHAAAAHDAIERALVTGHGEAYLAQSIFQLNRGDFTGGAAALGIALVRAPMSAQVHESAGRLLIELTAPTGPDDGRRHLETAIGLDPGRTQIIRGDLTRLDALLGRWPEADARLDALLRDPDPAVVQLGAVFEARLASWRGDRATMLAAAQVFAPRIEKAGHLLAFFQHTVATGALDRARWEQLTAMFTRRDHPHRMQVLGLQLMAEIAVVLDEPDLAVRALGHAADMGLVDVIWLDGCPLFARFAHDLSWRTLRDEIARRADRVLAAFRGAAS